MLFELVAWAVLLTASSVIGAGALAGVGAGQLRIGDRLVLGAWLGLVLLALALLATSLFVPLSPGVAATVASLAMAAAGAVLVRARREPPQRIVPDAPIPRWALVTGVGAIVAGAAALASDPVTLYDSLVYHLGIVHWLREHGTVRGVALLHARLGHVSTWFALAAPFESASGSGRAATVPLGLALVLVASQASLVAARIAARRATGPDWFLGLASVVLTWAAFRHNAASPSPDVPTNALIVVVAWSLLITGRHVHLTARRGHGRWLQPRLLPFVLAAAAAAVKLFALPAAVASAAFYAFAPWDDRGWREPARRLAVCGALGAAILAPFVAASIVASGCPLFPSPIGCLSAEWSVGSAAAADYAAYIRDVARWETRRTVAGATDLAWINSWIGAHPLVTVLAILSPLVAIVLRGRPRRHGVRYALLLAILGITFAAWQAPAPRFLFAYCIIIPCLAAAFPLGSRWARRPLGPDILAPVISTPRATSVAFVASAALAGLGYAVASQKINVRSAIFDASDVVVVAGRDLLVPAVPEAPSRLYRWRVNDVDLLTPVPRPVADTLSYHSAIDGDLGFEKCSTAPLPCTPYLPESDVRLRVPERGLAGGFVRRPEGAALSTRGPRCVGEVIQPFAATLAPPDARMSEDGDGEAECGARNSR